RPQHPAPQAPSPTRPHPPCPQPPSLPSTRACSPWGTMAWAPRTASVPGRSATAATWKSRSPRRCATSV
ncbi:MAPK8IP3 isoform 8, partial [Pongo abelii]